MGCVRFGLMSLEEMQHVARSQRLELELKRDTLARSHFSVMLWSHCLHVLSSSFAVPLLVILPAHQRN